MMMKQQETFYFFWRKNIREMTRGYYDRWRLFVLHIFLGLHIAIDEKFFVVLVILFEKSEKAMTAKGLKSGGRMIRFRSSRVLGIGHQWATLLSRVKAKNSLKIQS